VRVWVRTRAGSVLETATVMLYPVRAGVIVLALV
jgi:hypothetical protein